MIAVFPGTYYENRVYIGTTHRPQAGSDQPPTLPVTFGEGNIAFETHQSFERWPRIMVEIVRKLAEGNGATAAHILDEMDAALFDGDGKLKP